ncbi:hypothetical protein SINU_12875, partial [Sporolactobacillus inulinus CASD]
RTASLLRQARNLRGLAGTLFPQASRPSALILSQDTGLLVEDRAKSYTFLSCQKTWLCQVSGEGKVAARDGHGRPSVQ